MHSARESCDKEGQPRQCNRAQIRRQSLGVIFRPQRFELCCRRSTLTSIPVLSVCANGARMSRGMRHAWRLPQGLTRLIVCLLVDRTARASGCNCRGDGDAHCCPKWVCFAYACVSMGMYACVSRARLSCVPRPGHHAPVSACHDDDNSNAMQVAAAVTAHASSSSPRLPGLPLSTHNKGGGRERLRCGEAGRQGKRVGVSWANREMTDAAIRSHAIFTRMVAFSWLFCAFILELFPLSLQEFMR
jgi:hypothetical protein